MKKSLLLSTGTAVILGSLTAPSLVQPVEAASDVTIETVVFEHNGTQFTVSLRDYALALATKDGDFYDFYSEFTPDIKAIGISTGDYLNFRDYAMGVTFKSSSETVQDVLDELADSSDVIVEESTVSTYQSINGYDSNMEPIFEEAETPEVISID
ncbi:hypothetical protein [Pontibacillus sp. HMF3514]|uniref:hypothetical protein n=1 Tax=Pontibacillus sp. HMF3514 TaxID=2692425 RepID=UPI00131F7DF5|nr:hypothetical protein [Pontibacillus sp. HMF3514]QHE53751.1 hypothetical protein GS400_17770 [Pontibacillus sp. HMF3514]